MPVTKWTRLCKWCSSAFKTSRTHASYCSVRCRKAKERSKAEGAPQKPVLWEKGEIGLPVRLPILEPCWACLEMKPKGTTCHACGAFPAPHHPST